MKKYFLLLIVVSIGVAITSKNQEAQPLKKLGELVQPVVESFTSPNQMSDTSSPGQSAAVVSAEEMYDREIKILEELLEREDAINKINSGTANTEQMKLYMKSIEDLQTYRLKVAQINLNRAEQILENGRVQ